MTEKASTPGPQSRAELRAKLVTFSDGFWAKYLAQAGQHAEEAEWVALTGVDPTLQSDDTESRFILHRDADRRLWALRMSKTYGHIVKAIREAQADLGFDRESRWDVSGMVTSREFVWDGWDEAGAPNTPVVALRAVRIPDQFVVVVHPERGVTIPGIDKVRARLASIQSQQTQRLTTTPELLVEAIVAAVGEGDSGGFARLWAEGTSDRDVNYMREQYRKAWTASNGRIAIARYGGPDPAEDEACAETRVFLERRNTDGSVTSRPLTLVREGSEWRVKTGMI